MIEDMTLASYVPRTQDVFRRLAAHYMRSPDLLSEAEVSAYLLHLRDERGIARGTLT
jgi:integrase/recombinase XerD